MSTKSPSNFKMRRSLRLIGLDVIFALASMMMVIRWRYDFLNEPLRGSIDHKAAYLAAAVTLITWVALRQDRAMWRFTTLDDFKKISFGIAIVALSVKGGLGNNQHMAFNPVGLIETSGLYEGRTIRSVPVLGGPDNLRDIYAKTTGRQDKPLQIIAVDPSPDRRVTANLVKIAAELGAPLSRGSADSTEKKPTRSSADKCHGYVQCVGYVRGRAGRTFYSDLNR